MVLQDVTDGARLVKEGAPVLDAERLGHGDLDAAHVGAVPDRLEDGVGEARVEDVLHRLLAEVVVDSIDGVLGKVLAQDAVEFARRRQVAPERLLEHQAGAL